MSPNASDASPPPSPPATKQSSPPPFLKIWELYPTYNGYTRHESLECYAPGGFHPVSLGDTLLDGRYTIRLKLGFGGQSTVWLARDAESEIWVAIKIKSAQASEKGLDQDSEINILKKFEKYYCSIEETQSESQSESEPQSQSQSQMRCAAQLLNTFQHTGPNGTHNCIVTELLGPTLSDLFDWMYLPGTDTPITLPPDLVLRVSRQILQGLESVHGAGIAHGDVSPLNIALTCTQVDDEDMFEAAGGEPSMDEYDAEKNGPRPAGLPAHLIQCVSWSGWYIDRFEDIRFIDWGWSFDVNKTVTVLGQPDDLQAPETFFRHEFTYKHDLWGAGCVIYGMFHQRYPFSFIGDPVHFFIRILVCRLGPLPPAWQAKWEEMLVGYKYPDGYAAEIPVELFQDTLEPRRQEIRKRILHTDPDDDYDEEYDYEPKDEYSEYDVEALKCLLEPMLGLMRYEPEKRMSLQEAASLIDWTDYRREQNAEEEDDTDAGSSQEAESEEAEEDDSDAAKSHDGEE